MPKSSAKNLIVTNPAPVLTQKAHPVPLADITTPKIRQIIREMSEALAASPEGIGIAAPQIGYSLQIFLASEEALSIDESRKMTEKERKAKKWEHYVFINPIITNYSKKKHKDLEGCLSVPGKFGTVERSEKVTIEAYDAHGKKFRRGASKLYARLMQHDVDHLNGHLFIEKARGLVNIHDDPETKKRHG